MNTDAVFSTKEETWETLQEFFDELNAQYHFDLDPCATKENAKCIKYYTEKEDGLQQDWGGHTVFCNPPYGKNKTRLWIKKGYEESKKPNTIVVMLVPARTDTAWFHEYVLGKGEIQFVRGRMRFGNSKQPAPFPSIVVIYK